LNTGGRKVREFESRSLRHGRLAESGKAPVSRTGDGVTAAGVQILYLPPAFRA
jgi:hypothetical protein